MGLNDEWVLTAGILGSWVLTPLCCAVLCRKRRLGTLWTLSKQCYCLHQEFSNFFIDEHYVLFASEHRHKTSTRTSRVYKYVKQHYPISKEHQVENPWSRNIHTFRSTSQMQQATQGLVRIANNTFKHVCTQQRSRLYASNNFGEWFSCNPLCSSSTMKTEVPACCFPFTMVDKGKVNFSAGQDKSLEKSYSSSMGPVWSSRCVMICIHILPNVCLCSDKAMSKMKVLQYRVNSLLIRFTSSCSLVTQF
jgi:hypothetical protein